MIRELGDGLVLRRGTAADAEALAAFNADVLRPQDLPEPDPAFGDWTRDLFAGRHPSFTPADATIVEDTRTGAIVSSVLLIPQTWSFGGIPVTVGQPELVGTHADYRGRGLARAQFEVIHRWSAERGHQLLAIAGIPWFYRQFGYEMALERGGGPTLYAASVPPLPWPKPPRLRVRPMREDDLPFAVATDAHAGSRYLVVVPRGEALWRYELGGHREGSAVRRELRIIEAADGARVGVLSHPAKLFGASLFVTGFEVAPGASWREAWLAALAYLLATGEDYAARDGKRFGALSFWLLGAGHPVDRMFPAQGPRRATALYVRVPRLAGFLARVAPVLERRLADSPFARHDGELRLSFYRDGLRLVLEGGRLASAEAWTPTTRLTGQEWGMPSADERRASAMFPGLSFLQLLFGHRSLEELEAAFPDCIVRTNEARGLLTALFPKQPSHVWAIA